MDEKEIDFENEKRIIGILIGQYFEKSDIKQIDFLDTKTPRTKQKCLKCHMSCKNKEGICTNKTFIKMRNGQTVLNECQYEDMAMKLNMEYALNRKILESIKSISDELEKCMDSGIEREYRECLDFIDKELKKYKKYIYIKEMLQMFHGVAYFQLYQTLPYESHIKRLERIIDYLDEPMKYQAYYLVYRYYNLTHKHKNKSAELLETISKIYPEKVFFNIYLKRRKLTSLEYYKYLNSLEVSDFNRQDKFYVYNSLAFVSFNLDNYQEVIVNLKECIKIATEKNHEMTEKTILNLYTQYAMTQYELGNYNDSVEYYLKVYQSIPDLLVLNFILFIHSLEILHMEQEIEKLLELYDEDELEDKIVKAIYKYYQLKYIFKGSDKELSKYIVEEMAPILYKRSAFYDVIHDDLMKYCEKNRSYKSLVYFERNTR